MTETLEDATKNKRPEPTAEEKIAEELVRRAWEDGVSSTGPGGSMRNGTRTKTVLTAASGQVGIEVPRDRDGTFEPQIVPKRQRRLAPGTINHLTVLRAALGCITPDGGFVSKEDRGRLMLGPSCPAGSY